MGWMPPGSLTQPIGPYLQVHYCHLACSSCFCFYLIFPLQEWSHRPCWLPRINRTLFLSFLCLLLLWRQSDNSSQMYAKPSPSHNTGYVPQSLWGSTPSEASFKPPCYRLLLAFLELEAVSQGSMLLCLLFLLPARPLLA